MTRKKWLAAAAGAALSLSSLLQGGEGGIAHTPEPEVFAATSREKNAAVRIGGEIRVDYGARFAEISSPARPKATTRNDDLRVQASNLRIRADIAPNIKTVFKLDFAGSGEEGGGDDILEEAKIVMEAIGGSNWSLMAGKGRVPYGQDRTLGMIQSYHHSADRIDGSEGRIFIVDPPETPGGRGRLSIPPARPGQMERAVLAGAAYTFQDRWRAEVAIFQADSPGRDFQIGRPAGFSEPRRSFAARLWWQPFEGLTTEVSAMAVHGRNGDMLSPVPASRARSLAWAASAGFDWRRGPWSVFGEYQRGWNWNFTDGYGTEAFQLGATYEWRGRLRLGAMGEWLRLDSPHEFGGVGDEYSKLVLNARLALAEGSFVMLEYAREWFERENRFLPSERRRGDFLGVRFGTSF